MFQFDAYIAYAMTGPPCVASMKKVVLECLMMSADVDRGVFVSGTDGASERAVPRAFSDVSDDKHACMLTHNECVCNVLDVIKCSSIECKFARSHQKKY